MDEARLLTRILSEVAAARGAIATSYQRLWRPHGTARGEAAEPEPGSNPDPDAGTKPREE